MRSGIKELVELRNKHAKQLKKWMGKYQGFGKKCQTIQRVDQTILPLLQTSENINNDLIKQYDQSTAELTRVYKSISKERYPSLKSRLDEKYENVERTNKHFAEMEKKQTKLEKEKEKVKLALTNRTLDQSQRDDLKRKKLQLSTQLSNINQNIQVATENCNRATEDYEKNVSIILNISQQDEKKSLQLMESVLQDFNNALKRSSSFTNRTARHIVPAKKSVSAGKKYFSSLLINGDNDEDEDENDYEDIGESEDDDE